MSIEERATDSPRGLDRRTVLKGTAATAGATAVVGTTSSGAAEASDRILPARRRLRRPAARTRPALDPGHPDRGGHARAPGKGPQVTVRWQVATRPPVPARRPRRHGHDRPGPRPHGQGRRRPAWRRRPGTTTGSATTASPAAVGRTRTAPARDARRPTDLRFGVVSLRQLAGRLVHAPTAHLADRDDLHAVLHLGDYLYEYAPGEYGYGQRDVDIRPHDPAHEMVVARRLPAAARAVQDRPRPAGPAREVPLDHHLGRPRGHQRPVARRRREPPAASEGDYRERRARAHRAYDEWMPVRMDGTAELGDGTGCSGGCGSAGSPSCSMLDLRTYRGEQVQAASPAPSADAEISDPDRTITGDQQMAWLKDVAATGPGRSGRSIGNPVMIAPVDVRRRCPTTCSARSTTSPACCPEDGAALQRRPVGRLHRRPRARCSTTSATTGSATRVFLTGDIHSGWACELPYDAGDLPASATRPASSSSARSVTSNNLKDITGAPAADDEHRRSRQAIKANNRHIKYLNFDDHGFSVLDITAERAPDGLVRHRRPRRQEDRPSPGRASLRADAGTGSWSTSSKPVDA